jgi:hypothetical protein
MSFSNVQKVVYSEKKINNDHKFGYVLVIKLAVFA